VGLVRFNQVKPAGVELTEVSGVDDTAKLSNVSFRGLSAKVDIGDKPRIIANSVIFFIIVKYKSKRNRYKTNCKSIANIEIYIRLIVARSHN